MKAYWIALYKRIDSQENIKNYGEKVTEILKSYGAKSTRKRWKISNFRR